MAPKPARRSWVVDCVDTYRLRVTDLVAFLKKKFGEYQEKDFNVRVCVSYSDLKACVDMRSIKWMYTTFLFQEN